MSPECRSRICAADGESKRLVHDRAGGGGPETLPGTMRTLPWRKPGRWRWTFIKGRSVAPDVRRRKTSDSVGRNQRPDGAGCRHDIHNPAVTGHSLLLASTKWLALGKPTACGHARVVGHTTNKIKTS